ncbi:MAG: tetratricopeptide repeat protein [Planctomycetes bacterium]|nr:tetratricopeptide repeat protein [Planctomycetota bacterium]
MRLALHRWVWALPLCACGPNAPTPPGPPISGAAQQVTQPLDPQAAARAFAKAQRLRQERNYTAALGAVEEGLLDAPKDPAARRLRAELLLNLDRPDEAAAMLESLRTESPNDPVATGLLALTRREQGRTADALALFDSIPERMRPIREYADLLTRAGRHEEASAWVARLLVRDPWHDTAYYQLACVDQRRGREAQAAVWGERHRAFELVRSHDNSMRHATATGAAPRARTTLARSLAERGMWYEAMALLSAALREDPRLQEAARMFAELLGNLGQGTKRAQALRRCVELAPDDAALAAELTSAQSAKDRPILEVAREHAAAGRRDQARAASLFAAKRNMNDTAALLLVGELCNRPGDAFVRLWAWRQLRKLDPANASVEQRVRAECERLGIPVASVDAG